jgi:hypothetical protein
MALLDGKNLAAEASKRARFRVHHVGTKLNLAELHELEALAAKRKETQAELIRVFGVTPQQKKDCLNAWSNSALGKGVQFFSLYNLATNLSSLETWAEWTVLPAAKLGALSVLSNISSAVGGTEISSVIAGTTTTVTAAPVASGIATSESVGASVAPYGIAAATVLDMNASAGCMGMNGDSYFSSGQVGVF